MARMKVVLSWSGPASRELAATLRDWLRKVVQSVEPFMSEEDIDKGAQWLPALQGALKEAQFGVICVTPENVASEWLHFEAGAMWKAFGDAVKVCPVLLGFERAADLRPPLGTFQAAVIAEDEEVQRLVSSINRALPEGDRISSELLRSTVEMWLPELRKRLQSIKIQASAKRRSPDDMLTEILGIVRSLAQSETSAIRSAFVVAPTLEALFNLPEDQKLRIEALEEIHRGLGAAQAMALGRHGMTQALERERRNRALLDSDSPAKKSSDDT